MMIAAMDVHYFETGCAAACVLFSDYRDRRPSASYTRILPTPADYVPGEFYRRELPCLVTLLQQINPLPDEIVIDGYVMLGDSPGLGQHLFKYLDSKISVVGVAKSKFKGSFGIEAFRGKSTRPLYITSAGIDQQKAAEKIRIMHGAYRIPTILKQADILAREKAREMVFYNHPCASAD
jgi:deoxyribonuclease V